MGRILVVEDDLEVAEALCQVLERMGHETRLAVDGDDGLNKYQSERFDLVITDILMPKKSGMDVIKDLIKLEPEVKIIAISGGNDNLSSEECLRTPQFLVERTLQKPFTRTQIEGAVDRLIPRPGSEEWGLDSKTSSNWKQPPDSDRSRT